MAVYDDNAETVYHENRHKDGPSAASWLVPLLLIVVAFFTGWWANAYTTNNNSGSGFQPGVGGGPGNTNMVSPLPQNSTVSPSAQPMMTLTPTPSPTIIRATPTPTY